MWVAGKLGLGEISYVENLIAIRLNVASGDSAAEYCTDIGGTIAVQVVNDQVGAPIDTEQACDLDSQTRLLPGFAHRRIGRMLAGFNQASWHDPNVLIGMEAEQEAHLFVVYSDGRRWQ